MKATKLQQPPKGGSLRRRVRQRVDRDWHEYPIGTRAYFYNGGWSERVERGWQSNGSKDVFPSPGGDAVGECIEWPNLPVSHAENNQTTTPQ